MNSVNLIGNITRDLELKATNNGHVLKFGIAVSSFRKDENGDYKADFINCLAFNKTAETIANYFRKGSKIGISGSWQTGKFTAEDGRDIYTNECLVNNITFVERKSDNDNGFSNTNSVSPSDFVDGADLPF